MKISDFFRGLRFAQMASPMNDALSLKTHLGYVNYYDNHHSVGTAAEKRWAAMSGGHDHDPISHRPASFLRHLRSSIDANGTYHAI